MSRYRVILDITTSLELAASDVDDIVDTAIREGLTIQEAAEYYNVDITGFSTDGAKKLEGDE